MATLNIEGLSLEDDEEEMVIPGESNVHLCLMSPFCYYIVGHTKDWRYKLFALGANDGKRLQGTHIMA